MAKKGFTLIELMVVISIVSLLSSIILSSLVDAKKKGRDGARIIALRETRTALQLYFADRGIYPKTSTWSNDLINNNYIKSVNTAEIVYVSGIINGSTLDTSCTTTCSWYHMAIPLDRRNAVLNSDADIGWGFGPNGSGLGQQNVDGVSNTGVCLSASDQAGTATDDLCYDLAP